MKYVKVCPKCKSTDVVQDKSTLQQTGMLPTLYICNNCNHSGHIFLEVTVDELNKFQSDADNKGLRDTKKDKSKLLDTSYGNFQVRFIWKFTGPFLLFFAIILFLAQEMFIGTIILVPGLIMTFITYFKKQKITS